MKDEKKPLEQKQNSEEEEYSFLQEIIKDEAGDQAKWKHDVLRRIQLRYCIDKHPFNYKLS